MVQFLKFLAATAFAIHVALGPANLAVEVCHGEVQLPSADGAPCCAPEHCRGANDEEDPCGPTYSESDCWDCYAFELAGSDEPVELVSPVGSLPQRGFNGLCETVCPEHPSWRWITVCAARGPPDALTPTGLLPGVFPLRI